MEHKRKEKAPLPIGEQQFKELDKKIRHLLFVSQTDEFLKQLKPGEKEIRESLKLDYEKAYNRVRFLPQTKKITEVSLSITEREKDLNDVLEKKGDLSTLYKEIMAIRSYLDKWKSELHNIYKTDFDVPLDEQYNKIDGLMDNPWMLYEKIKLYREEEKKKKKKGVKNGDESVVGEFMLEILEGNEPFRSNGVIPDYIDSSHETEWLDILKEIDQVLQRENNKFLEQYNEFLLKRRKEQPDIDLLDCKKILSAVENIELRTKITRFKEKIKSQCKQKALEAKEKLYVGLDLANEERLLEDRFERLNNCTKNMLEGKMKLEMESVVVALDELQKAVNNFGIKWYLFAFLNYFGIEKLGMTQENRDKKIRQLKEDIEAWQAQYLYKGADWKDLEQAKETAALLEKRAEGLGVRDLFKHEKEKKSVREKIMDIENMVDEFSNKEKEAETENKEGKVDEVELNAIKKEWRSLLDRIIKVVKTTMEEAVTRGRNPQDYVNAHFTDTDFTLLKDIEKFKNNLREKCKKGSKAFLDGLLAGLKAVKTETEEFAKEKNKEVPGLGAIGIDSLLNKLDESTIDTLYSESSKRLFGLKRMVEEELDKIQFRIKRASKKKFGPARLLNQAISLLVNHSWFETVMSDKERHLQNIQNEIEQELKARSEEEKKAKSNEGDKKQKLEELKKFKSGREKRVSEIEKEAKGIGIVLTNEHLDELMTKYADSLDEQSRQNKPNIA